jgi:hypothetical protein
MNLALLSRIRTLWNNDWYSGDTAGVRQRYTFDQLSPPRIGLAIAYGE